LCVSGCQPASRAFLDTEASSVAFVEADDAAFAAAALAFAISAAVAAASSASD